MKITFLVVILRWLLNSKGAHAVYLVIAALTSYGFLQSYQGGRFDGLFFPYVVTTLIFLVVTEVVMGLLDNFPQLR